MAIQANIGFLGAGKMATALARGFIQTGLATPDTITASDPSEQARAAFAKATAAKTTSSNRDAAGFAKVLVLAVKPDQTGPVLSELRPHLSSDHLVLSIAAGVTLARLEGALDKGNRVVRLMPNTPALLGASATAFALGTTATQADGELVEELFSAVGLAIRVKEQWLDAVTGLSGSGPAYVYLMIEALSDGGVAVGLPRETATKLAAQTVLGAARMVLETGLHPAPSRTWSPALGAPPLKACTCWKRASFEARS